MCGIIGLINSSEKVNPVIIEKASSMLFQRGPDSSGTWIDKNIGLAHRRLSILDITDAGSQPMLSKNERYAITFNGEIYNYKEIRKVLDLGTSYWRSNSDTEVIMAAYERWGVNCLNYFQGMFAFAIWDRLERKLFAARDRMGVKPFYYYHSDSCFSFSSRPGPLFCLCPNLSKEINTQSLRLFLEAGYFPSYLCIYKKVHKLPAGSYLILDERGLQIKKYWDFNSIEVDKNLNGKNESELLEELDDIISRCVRSRMVSDVPIGAFLSGGIDSSLVAALMSKYSSEPVKTFTIGFKEKNYDESTHADAVAKYIGSEHHCEYLGVNDLLGLMNHFFDNFDEPFFDSSAFPTMAVSRLASRFVKVSLSGDGGDELFGGYHYYDITQKIAPAFKLPAVIRNLSAYGIGLFPFHKFKLLRAALLQKDDIGVFSFSRSISKDFPSVLFPEAIDETYGLYDLFYNRIQAFPFDLEPGEKGMRLDASYTLTDDYLQKVDIASMAYSLESREPLLDQELIEWSMRLPLKWKLAQGYNKYLLRKLAYRYVPKNILDRPKQGFAVPIAEWIRGPLHGWVLELINDKNLYVGLPLNQKVVLDMMKLHCSGGRDVHPQLWAVVMLLGFLKKYR